MSEKKIFKFFLGICTLIFFESSTLSAMKITKHSLPIKGIGNGEKVFAYAWSPYQKDLIALGTYKYTMEKLTPNCYIYIYDIDQEKVVVKSCSLPRFNSSISWTKRGNESYILYLTNQHYPIRCFEPHQPNNKTHVFSAKTLKDGEHVIDILHSNEKLHFLCSNQQSTFELIKRNPANPKQVLLSTGKTINETRLLRGNNNFTLLHQVNEQSRNPLTRHHINFLSWHPSLQHLIIAASENNIILRSSSGSYITSGDPENTVLYLDFHREKPFIAAALVTSTKTKMSAIRLWNLENQKIIYTLFDDSLYRKSADRCCSLRHCVNKPFALDLKGHNIFTWHPFYHNWLTMLNEERNEIIIWDVPLK